MCYKNEVQKNAADKLDDKVKDMPEYIKDYFIYLKSCKSKLNYWSVIRQLLEWLISQNIINSTLENISVDEIRKVEDKHIIKYLEGLKSGIYGTKISKATANTKKNIYSGFWSYLAEKNIVEKNIINKSVHEHFRIKENTNKKIKVPADAEIENFISNLCNIKSEIVAIRNIAIVKLFMGSGLRIEELVGLDMEDLYFDNPKCRYVMIMEKGEYDEKVQVLINESAYNALTDYIQIRNADPLNKDRKHLFVSENGGRLAQSSIQDFFKEYSDGKITPHMLRHYFGTMLYKNSNHNIKLVCKRLRHHDVNTSIKYYVEEDEEEANEALNSF